MIWAKLIVAKGFKKLPKVQKIARSGHTALKAVLLFYLLSFSCFARIEWTMFGQIQTSQTEGQPYSDTSTYEVS